MQVAVKQKAHSTDFILVFGSLNFEQPNLPLLYVIFKKEA